MCSAQTDFNLLLKDITEENSKIKFQGKQCSITGKIVHRKIACHRIHNIFVSVSSISFDIGSAVLSGIYIYTYYENYTLSPVDVRRFRLHDALSKRRQIFKT